ncbi:MULTISPECIES: porin family protein [Halomonadaceae]|uniref:Outer membrane autotransporter protein/predicted outer membrane protein n=1 Tax=Onishia taeanensis TaxID=284577 RepID=A0A328XZC8_9GAMM|nr:MULTISPECIES: porin family protein [Halomonas]RAR62923.1 outer membrane autotransporter protein/predicted outer membrane protein [Halomonas taeanensis]
MKRLIAPVAACAVVGALGVSGSAQAEQMSITPAAYLGADVMFWNFDPQGSSSAESEALRLRAGMQFNDYFAIEGHLATGGSDSIGGVDIDLDYLAGIFAKGFLPVSREFRLYALLGASEVSFNDVTFNGDDSESGFSGGVGAEFDMSRNLSFGADYIRYLDEDNFTFDGFSLGATYRF